MIYSVIWKMSVKEIEKMREMPMPPDIAFGHQSTPVFGMIFFLIIMLFALLTSILMVVAYCKICSRTGHNWALGLLMLVPVANVVLPLILAFTDWPIQKELRQLKQQ